MTTVAPGNWSARAVDRTELAAGTTPPVLAAIDDVRRSFADDPVTAWPDGQGGALVVMEEVDLGPTWTPGRAWLGFAISYLHPEADCYPHYLAAEVCRSDGVPLAVPFHPGQVFTEVPAVMVSRRSPRRSAALDTPARKTLSVLTYIRTCP